jgi:hypothetical protein
MKDDSLFTLKFSKTNLYMKKIEGWQIFDEIKRK